MEIEAGDGMADAERPLQHVGDEILGRLGGEVAVKGCSTSASKPSCGDSRAFIGGGVSTNSGMSGRKTVRGCGSKVSTSAGTSRRPASLSARSSTA